MHGYEAALCTVAGAVVHMLFVLLAWVTMVMSRGPWRTVLLQRMPRHLVTVVLPSAVSAVPLPFVSAFLAPTPQL